MKTLSSYDRAFGKIANKMDQIIARQERAKEIAKQDYTLNRELMFNIADGKLCMSKIKYRNFLKRLFTGKMSSSDMGVISEYHNYVWDGNIQWQLKQYIDENNPDDIDAVKRIYDIPGTVGLFITLNK